MRFQSNSTHVQGLGYHIMYMYVQYLRSYKYFKRKIHDILLAWK